MSQAIYTYEINNLILNLKGSIQETKVSMTESASGSVKSFSFTENESFSNVGESYENLLVSILAKQFDFDEVKRNF